MKFGCYKPRWLEQDFFCIAIHNKSCSVSIASRPMWSIVFFKSTPWVENVMWLITYTERLCSNNAIGFLYGNKYEDSSFWDTKCQKWWRKRDGRGLLLNPESAACTEWVAPCTRNTCKAICSNISGIVGPELILQQDNDPKHASRLWQNYIRRHEGLKSWNGQ